MKTLPFLFSGTAAFNPQAAADLVMGHSDRDTLQAALGGLQTGGGLPPALGDALLEFQESPDQNGEARLRLAQAILETPAHRWRRVTLPQERQRSQWEYLDDVTERLAQVSFSAGRAVNDEERRLMRSLEGGLNAFSGSDFLYGDAHQVDLFCRRVAETLQNAALQTLAELADTTWPSLATFMAVARTEGYLPFSYHQRAGQTLEHENEEKIQYLAAQMQKNGITWPYRFVDWTRSLYLTAGNLENGHKKAAMLAFSKSLGTLLKTQPLTEGDLRKELGGIALTLGLPLPDLPENWPNDLPTTVAKWLIHIWDASQEVRDWKILEACIQSWTACWRNSETKENKNVIRYELERWLNNAANSVTWRRTGNVIDRMDELETILAQVDQNSLEILRGTRTPSPLRAPWRAPRRTISGTVTIPEGFHFAGRLRAEKAGDTPGPQEEATAEDAKPASSIVDESVFSAIPTLTPHALVQPPPLVPALDASWLSSVMATDTEEARIAPASEITPTSEIMPASAIVPSEIAPKPEIMLGPEIARESVEEPRGSAPALKEQAAESLPAATREDSRGPQRLWTPEMRTFIKRNNLTRYESVNGGFQEFAIPRGRQDFIQVAGKNWRGPNQKTIAEAVQACAEGTPHYERVRELMKPLFNGNIQASPTRRALDGFLKAIALLVHHEQVDDADPAPATDPTDANDAPAPPEATFLAAWAKAVSPSVIQAGVDFPGWSLIRRAIIDALGSEDATRKDAERLEQARSAEIPETFAVILQKDQAVDALSQMDGRWLALARLQYDSSMGNPLTPSDAQAAADLMAATAQAMDQADVSATSDPHRLKRLSEEAASGWALCQNFLSSLIEEEDERLEILIETEDIFRRVVERAEQALLEAEENASAARGEISDMADDAQAQALSDLEPPSANPPSSDPSEKVTKLQSAAEAALRKLADIRSIENLTLAGYAAISASSLPTIDHFLKLYETFETHAVEEDDRIRSLEPIARTLRDARTRWRSWEAEVPLTPPVERPSAPSFLTALPRDRVFQIGPETSFPILQFLSKVPETEYWRVNSVMELALIADDEAVYSRLLMLLRVLSESGNDGYLVEFAAPGQPCQERFYPKSIVNGSEAPWNADIPKKGDVFVTDLAEYTPRIIQKYLDDPQYYFRNKVEYLHHLVAARAREEGITLPALLRGNPRHGNSKAWSALRKILAKAGYMGTNVIAAFAAHPQRDALFQKIGSEFTIDGAYSVSEYYKNEPEMGLAMVCLGYPEWFAEVLSKLGAMNVLKPLMKVRSIGEVVQDFSSSSAIAAAAMRKIESVLSQSGHAAQMAHLTPEEWRKTLDSALVLSTPSDTHLLLREEDKAKAGLYATANREKNGTFEDPLTGNKIILRKHGYGYRFAPASEASGWHREILRRLDLVAGLHPFYLDLVSAILLGKNPKLGTLAPEMVRTLMRDMGPSEATAEDIQGQIAVFVEFHLMDLIASIKSTNLPST